MSTHETFDFAPYIVVCFVVQVGDAEVISQAFVFERLDPFSLSQSEVFKSHTNRGGWGRPKVCRLGTSSGR